MNFSAKISCAALLFLGSIIPTTAQENSSEMATGFVSDELFIFMHTGPGNNYRILGSIDAGTELQLHGDIQNNYQKVTDNRGREGWIESRFVSNSPGLKSVVEDLNEQLATTAAQLNQVDAELVEKTQLVQSLEAEISQQKSQIEDLSKQIASKNEKLDTQDMEVKKEWFYTGAIVLGIGLLLGAILPKLFGTRRRSQMESWR